MANKKITGVHVPHYVPAWTALPLWGDAGLEPGDAVKVTGATGSFAFKAVHVKEDKVIAVHVFGGPNGNTTDRFFAPERVSKVVPKGKRRRRAVEEDAA
jgi:hypothetical protein